MVHATNPVPYAVSLTTHQSLLPLPQKVVEKLGDAWVKKENYVGNGAYKLTNHIINEKSNLNVTHSIGTIKRLSLTVQHSLRLKTQVLM